ncbi:hypothetical protein [Agaribacter marinus]|uniref:Uncharacterized protein n=1 Tax=Agaribacter marinus TaxID=1431249 RepID=A0AA37SWH9_9ALTE|nr:hypothetical protein [Agaribacter marinus]GLR69929.1 hypothetical protein GCM10007852_08370 [Agaribacter marinus]
MYSNYFSMLECGARYGCNGESKEIIARYVCDGLNEARTCETMRDTKRNHMRVVNTLMNALCDDCVDVKWRKECYMFLRKLKPLMYEMLCEDEYDALVSEIQTYYVYFLAPHGIRR